MSDTTEDARRKLVSEFNQDNYQPEGQTWTTEELTRDFEVQGFAAPFVVARRKSDGKVGTLAFRHHPRIYFGWAPDGGEN